MSEVHTIAAAPTTASQTQQSNKVTRPRAASYPALTLEESIDLIKQLHEKLGDGPYAREDIARAFGHSTLSGPASGKIAACSQFGLLERLNNTYLLSNLAKQIIIPTDEFERNEAIIMAVLSPQMYSKLVSSFENRALPTMLDNILIREFDVSSKVAKRAAADFKASMQFAGLLKDGVLRTSKTPLQSNNDNPDYNANAAGTQSSVAPQSSAIPQPIQAKSESHNSVAINIPGTDIKVVFPEEYAFDLSTGAFAEGLKALKTDIEKLHIETEEGQVNEA